MKDKNINGPVPPIAFSWKLNLTVDIIDLIKDAIKAGIDGIGHWAA